METDDEADKRIYVDMSGIRVNTTDEIPLHKIVNCKDIIKDDLLANLYATVEFLKRQLEEKDEFIKRELEEKNFLIRTLLLREGKSYDFMYPETTPPENCKNSTMIETGSSTKSDDIINSNDSLNETQTTTTTNESFTSVNDESLHNSNSGNIIDISNVIEVEDNNIHMEDTTVVQIGNYTTTNSRTK